MKPPRKTDKKLIKPMGLNFVDAERPFIEAMKLSNDGEDLLDASEMLSELVRKVRDTGGKGHVTVKIAVDGVGKRVGLTVDVTAKLPKEKRRKTALFADENGRLGMADPDQYELDLDHEGEVVAVETEKK